MDFLGKVSQLKIKLVFDLTTTVAATLLTSTSASINSQHAQPFSLKMRRRTKNDQIPDTKDIEEFEKMVMEGCDSNGDGKINKKELTTVLLALAKHASEGDSQPTK